MSKGFTAVDLATCAKYLKMVEEHGLRRPKPTYVATRLLLDNPARAKLTKRDQYARMETHAVAALDLGDVESGATRRLLPPQRLPRIPPPRPPRSDVSRGSGRPRRRAEGVRRHPRALARRTTRHEAPSLVPSRGWDAPKPPSTRWWNIWTRSWRTWTRGRLSRGYTRNCACTSRRCSAGRRCSWRSRRSPSPSKDGGDARDVGRRGAVARRQAVLRRGARHVRRHGRPRDVRARTRG